MPARIRRGRVVLSKADRSEQPTTGRTLMMFLDCPAYLDGNAALRCGLPAEVEDRVTMRSTSGPVEILKIRCPAGHWFNGPLESLIPPAPDEASLPVTAGPERTR
jgi:hypothetical protein